MSESVVCTVRFNCGTHQTNTVRGQRASSTMSFEHAAQVLATKLFPSCPARVTQQRPDPTQPGVQRFLIEPC